ncbi:hypothetical protein NPIL_183811 [Nephila pilipes]|uniref:Uncharacterized protein n=1 Tax=Nephila pilipes TaxID=299642 RepID=A0A8X6MKZ0_NEPPI|nr:hypothetical protein NPIL_183811 [Nephila pilipes]
MMLFVKNLFTSFLQDLQIHTSQKSCRRVIPSSILNKSRYDAVAAFRLSTGRLSSLPICTRFDSQLILFVHYMIWRSNLKAPPSPIWGSSQTFQGVKILGS